LHHLHQMQELMNDSGTICHCDIRVTSYEKPFLCCLSAHALAACIKRFIFLMFKITALICLKDFICRSIIFCKSSKYRIQQEPVPDNMYIRQQP
jgi:hypothetical protein